MELLEHKLIKKYWPCLFATCAYGYCGDACYGLRSRSILYAMHDPIKYKERYLDITDFPKVKVMCASVELDWIHFESLRLPDKFQGKDKKHGE